MSAYFIANIRLTDEAEYDKYLEECSQVFEKFNGEYLAVDESPVVLEGQWKYTKAVLIRFPDAEALLEWYRSEDYQRILKYRLLGSECDTILVHGLDME